MAAEGEGAAKEDQMDGQRQRVGSGKMRGRGSAGRVVQAAM